MRTMTQKMMASSVPVVVYVSPSGARAGSAGVFITLAADVAAMAPHTNIGAAHPVSSGGQMDDVMQAKVTNDAAALARTLAARRGRSEAWAEQAVRESASITEREAVEGHVVDLIAADLPDLLAKLDGQTVESAAGPRVLHTRDATVRTLEMTLLERALHTLIDPNIAYLLFTIGVWALIAEFYHPGALVPGLTGVVCLVLAFVAFESLPMNWAGVGLLLLAMGLFVADVKAPTHGALTAGGVICFVLGSLMLFSPVSPEAPLLPAVQVSPMLVAGVTAGLASFFLFAVQAGIRAQRLPAVSGATPLAGAVGLARSRLQPGGPGGSVQVCGETWTAVADREAIAPGDAVEVVGADGLRLRVRKR
jgi:membrane-bound serine protease (ClpP class)